MAQVSRVVVGDGGHGRLISAMTGTPCFGAGHTVPPDVEVFIGVGELSIRRRLYEEFGARVIGVIDNSANIAGNVKTGPGLQAFVGVIVSVGVVLGANVLLNTGAQIDHDCCIGDHCVISPGAILCGNVTLGEGCFVGAGAVIIQGVTLDAGTFVPAGTLVCGPRDFRRPQRMVLDSGTDAIARGAFESLP